VVGHPGIYTGGTHPIDKVIEVGDPLFGSTVTGLEFFRSGINDAGQLAFFASLSDGRFAIVRADPAPLSSRTPSTPRVPRPFHPRPAFVHSPR
jgi:hypothetical protein